MKKIIIFVDSIEKDIASKIYLQILLLNNMKNREDNIIKSFLSVLKVKIKTNWLETFLNSNTRIIIYIDVIKMGGNILDIKHVI